jgi:hypothetical protein
MLRTLTQVARWAQQLHVIVCVGPTKRNGHYVIDMASIQLYFAVNAPPTLLMHKSIHNIDRQSPTRRLGPSIMAIDFQSISITLFPFGSIGFTAINV